MKLYGWSITQMYRCWYLIFVVGMLMLVQFSFLSVPVYAAHSQLSGKTTIIPHHKKLFYSTKHGTIFFRRKHSFPTQSAYGKVIVVDLSHQWLYAYQNGKQVFDAAVITGRPSLPTPAGTYHVFAKFSPTTFYSPWPRSSPYWYIPTTVRHALEFKAGGFFLHDSYWHTVYGPGMSGWHHDPVYGWQWGSHGCVSMPDSAASWLYNWAQPGTTVHIVA